MPPRYPLADLLRVRRFREDAAAVELTARRAAVEGAQRRVEESRKAVVDYRVWRLRREEELWGEVLGKPVPRQEIDDLKLTIDGLRQRELTLEEEVRTAEKGLEEAREQFRRARAAHQSATKDRQKIDEHRELWTAELDKRMEYTHELELEDFRTRDFDEADEAEPEGA